MKRVKVTTYAGHYLKAAMKKLKAKGVNYGRVRKKGTKIKGR